MTKENFAMIQNWDQFINNNKNKQQLPSASLRAHCDLPPNTLPRMQARMGKGGNSGGIGGGCGKNIFLLAHQIGNYTPSSTRFLSKTRSCDRFLPQLKSTNRTIYN